MNLRLEKDLPVLLFALVCASTVAALPQMESNWNGVKEVYGEQDFGLRILREVMLLVLIVYGFLEPRLRQGILTGSVFAFLSLIATYVLCEVAYALYLDLPLVVPMAGLRVFEYMPVALIGFAASRLGAGQYVLYKFAYYLRYYIALQTVLAITQALWAPPILGVSLLGGGRPFGTFVSPNLFGAAMATCSLLFAVVPGMRKMDVREHLSGLAERFAHRADQLTAGGVLSDLRGAPSARPLGTGHARADSGRRRADTGIQPPAQRPR